MGTYQCPICNEKLPRDAALFLDHGNQHVIDSIKKAHPKWVSTDGVCRGCYDYFIKQMRGESVKNTSCGKN